MKLLHLFYIVLAFVILTSMMTSEYIRQSRTMTDVRKAKLLQAVEINSTQGRNEIGSADDLRKTEVHTQRSPNLAQATTDEYTEGTTPAPTLPPQSAFEAGGYAKLNLMQKLEEKRPLFNFTLKPWNIKCTDETVDNHTAIWSMVTAVKSRPEDQVRRELIRDTWGSSKTTNGLQIKVFFIVGNAAKPQGEMNLLKESKQYGDILQIDRAEVYKDVGYKALAGMQWVEEHCSRHWIYSSSDDDMVPDLQKLSKAIDTTLAASSANTSQELPIICSFSMRVNGKPDRIWKNTTPLDLYPLNIYPPYCAGGFYSMSVGLSSAIFQMSREHKYFFIDDAWITGLLRLAVMDAGTHPCRDITDEACQISTANFKLARHYPKYEQLLKTWKESKGKTS